MSVPLAVTGALLAGEPVGVRCAEGRIVAIGPEVAPAAGDTAIDAAGSHLLPTLVNGHTHAAMTLFRGSGGDLPLMPWLEERIWPVEAKLEAADVEAGAALACAEMLSTGVSHFWDMYWHPEATSAAVRAAGIRATIGAPLFDRGRDPGEMRDSALSSLEFLADQGPLISPALAPHSIYMVSEESLGWIAELGAEREVPIHIHLSETDREVQDCIAAHGVRPAHYLDRLGMLSERTVLAHGVWLDPEELALIAERGCTVVTNPVANMKLAVGGVFPYPAAKAAGAALGLGTDGAGSNDSLDLLSDLKAFALIQKHAAGDPTAIEVAEALAIARGERSPLLRGGEPAPLTVGAPADFLLARAEVPELAIGELDSNLVYAAGAAALRTVVVAGRELVRDGEVPGRSEIVSGAAERARRLGL